MKGRLVQLKEGLGHRDIDSGKKTEERIILFTLRIISGEARAIHHGRLLGIFKDNEPSARAIHQQ